MISTLPTYLQERTRVHGDKSPKGEFVLYWMRTAVRADENPALDVARIIAGDHIPLSPRTKPASGSLEIAKVDVLIGTKSRR